MRCIALLNANRKKNQIVYILNILFNFVIYQVVKTKSVRNQNTDTPLKSKFYLKKPYVLQSDLVKMFLKNVLYQVSFNEKDYLR